MPQVTLDEYLRSKPRGYAQELSKKLGMNKVYLSSIRNGHRMISVAVMLDIERLEGISLDVAAMQKAFKEKQEQKAGELQAKRAPVQQEPPPVTIADRLRARKRPQ